MARKDKKGKKKDQVVESGEQVEGEKPKTKSPKKAQAHGRVKRMRTVSRPRTRDLHHLLAEESDASQEVEFE